jgi:sterol desaturase/sphingolipid hydroxylase (fatty acid hydroxylase superfamily)
MSLSLFQGVLPVSQYKREQAGISRRSLYPVTVFYVVSAAILLTLAMRTGHPFLTLGFFIGGLPLWTFTEYTSHRWVFHKHWPISKRPIKKYFTYLSNRYLEPTHFGHHERPFDGTHINGRVRDLLPIFAVAVPVSLIFFPWYSAPALLGGVVFCYVLEEWIHHCEHYYNFQNRYFRHIKKAHLYHHSSQGVGRGYGITNAFWDVVFNTRYSPEVRQRLFGPSKRKTVAAQTADYQAS